MSMALMWGNACHRQATRPVTTGVEKEVPMSRTMVPRPEMSVAGEPMAMTSGFTRPSCVGPTDEKGAFSPSGLMAPTVSISWASAGMHIYFHGPMPALPAELTSIMPFRASMEAVRLMSVVFPSSSSYVTLW